MYADLVAGGDLQQRDGTGAFAVLGDNSDPLIIEDLFAFERYFGSHYLIDHACRRTVILSDLHTQVGAMYINSVPGGFVYIENVCTTDQFAPNKNCFSFTGQQVWARQLNPERANPQVLNNARQLIICVPLLKRREMASRRSSTGIIFPGEMNTSLFYRFIKVIHM